MTTKSNSDETTITATKSNRSTEGSNSTSSNSSDTSTTRNSQTVTTYKDGRKTESGSSSYEKWSSESTSDSKGLVSSVSKSSSWSSSYSKSYFKGGYSWTETVSGYESESVTKGRVSTSNGSSWSWTRSGTVWDDGRNNWSESWSKSSWKDGKYAPSESEVTRGSFDPKGTGTQTNNLPKFGEAPRLTKAPKKQVPPDLLQPPKPSKDMEIIPTVIIKEPQFKEVFGSSGCDSPSGGSGNDDLANNPSGGSGGGGNPGSGKWPPQDIGSYWLSYTGTLNTTSQQRRQIFRDIINNPSIKKVYMNVLSTQGTTFRYKDSAASMIPGLDGQDVFAEFKDELDKYNKANPNKRRDIEVIGWFEGSGLAAPSSPSYSSPMYKAAEAARYMDEPKKNAVLSHKGDGGFPYVDLLHPSVWGELQNIATDFIKKHGGLVKEIIFDDRLGIPKAAEAEVANLHRSTITADKDSSAKSWIQRALTKNLANLKKALPSTKFSISANQPAIARENQNQLIGEWIQGGIINGDYNLQLYKNGNEYQSFVTDYNKFIPQMLDLLNQNKSRLSISLIYRARGENLKRKDLIDQATFLRNNGLLPPQIIGFDYQKIKNIPA